MKKELSFEEKKEALKDYLGYYVCGTDAKKIAQKLGYDFYECTYFTVEKDGDYIGNTFANRLKDMIDLDKCDTENIEEAYEGFIKELKELDNRNKKEE